MTDQRENVQAILPLMPVEVKEEPETDSASDTPRCSEDSEEAESVQAPKFLDVKNRFIFDFDSITTTLNDSAWPKEWLTAVESKFKLRTSEAAKNVGLYQKLQQLMTEVKEVSFPSNC